MRILRLENELGEGVFTCGAVSRSYDYIPYHSDAHCSRSPSSMPGPYSDKGIRREMRNEEYCGFTSFEQYREWFGHQDYDDALDKAGIKISIYEVADQHVTVGHVQVLFVLREAKKVDRQPISYYRESQTHTQVQIDVGQLAWDALTQLQERLEQC